MPNTSTVRQAPSPDRSFGPVGTAVAVAILLTGFRLALALLDRTELSTDEAQYWFWGQTPSFGAYSKPPLIGWIIRLSTDLLGQTVVAVRLPAILMHAATAAVIFACARRLAPGPVAALSALLYLVSPGVALGSALMTTDTPLLLAASVAMLAQMQAGAANAAGSRARAAAVVLGLALGLGFLAKYAMLFWLAGAVAAAAVSPGFRLHRSDLLIACAVATAVVAPHLVWLVQHGFITFAHVQAITDGTGASVPRPLRFIAEQFLVAGPIGFAAMAVAVLRDRSDPALAALAMAPLLIIVAQAVRGPVLANWAVLYLVPGSILAARLLMRHRWLARVSLALGLAVSLALPLAKAFGTGLKQPDGRPLLARYLGHSEMAHWALGLAAAERADVLVARDRDLLADLSWFSTGPAPRIRAVPPSARPANHWEMVAPFRSQDGTNVLLLLRSTPPPSCTAAQEIARLDPPQGDADEAPLIMYRLPDPACLLAKTSESETE